MSTTYLGPPPSRYRKFEPDVVEAFGPVGQSWEFSAIDCGDWIIAGGGQVQRRKRGDGHGESSFGIVTQGRVMRVWPGDYVIRDAQGAFIRANRTDFNATYELLAGEVERKYPRESVWNDRG